MRGAAIEHRLGEPGRGVLSAGAAPGLRPLDGPMPPLHHDVMVRTQIQLDEEQYEAVRRLAHRQRLSLAAAIRKLIDEALHGKRPRRARGARALLGVAGVGSSGLGDLGRRHDHYLAEEGKGSR